MLSDGDEAHGVLSNSDCSSYDIGLCKYEGGETCTGGQYWCFDWQQETEPARGDTGTATATINSSSAGLGGVVADGAEAARVAGETRPKNMKAVFIMRVE